MGRQLSRFRFIPLPGWRTPTKRPNWRFSTQRRQVPSSHKTREVRRNPVYQVASTKNTSDAQYTKSKNNKLVANTATNVELHDFDEQIKSMITKSDISAGHNRGFLSTCNVCGKEAPFNDMRRHVETNHITGVSHSCSMCWKISRTRQALRMHKLRNHNNDRTLNSMFCSWNIHRKIQNVSL